MEATRLDGQFLIAMPSMEGDFARTVIYVCAHTDDGAMGIVINKTQQIEFRSLLSQLEVIEADSAPLSDQAEEIVVREGGPVEPNRGFVLHSSDYQTSSSMRVTETVSLTATIDILRAIAAGNGPSRAAMALGYAGWGAGQLEGEIKENGWLTMDGTEELIFDPQIAEIYDRAMSLLGIDPAHLSGAAGHA